MKDERPRFKIIPPDPPRSPAVREFFADHPDLDVKRSLQFLLSQYPDTGRWVLDSGVAVQLLTGRRELAPHDIDIVCRDEEMELDFGHTNGLDPHDIRYIDVKSLRHWLSGRIGVDEQLPWDYIVATSSLENVDGLVIRVMHPALIAAGKSTLAKMNQRPKDISDLAILNVDNEQLVAATKLFCGYHPDRQLLTLV